MIRNIEIVEEEADDLVEFRETMKTWGYSCKGKITPKNLKYPSECVYTKMIQIPGKIHRTRDDDLMTEIDKIVMIMPDDAPRRYKRIIQLHYAFPTMTMGQKLKLCGVSERTFWRYLRLSLLFIINNLKRKNIY